MKRRLLGPLLTVGVIAGWGYEANARRREAALGRAGRLVDAGTHRVRVYEAGEGQPSVVLVPGAGDCAASWTYIQRQVPSFSRVTSYDRARIGGGEPGPPPSLDHCLDELGRVLEGVAAGPCVLVGHSLGGLLVSQYALRQPDQIRGLVLVDPTPEAVAGDAGVKAGFAVSGVLARFFQLGAPIGLIRLLLVSGMMPLYPEQPRFRALVSGAEYTRWVADVCRTFATSVASDELRAVLTLAEAAGRLGEGVLEPRFGHLPLGVLTSHAFGEKWIGWHRQLASRSTNSFQRVTDTKAHNIHLRHPDVVVQAIRDVVGMARA
jgi:pimeloyl-ACP methyl ester carboxylesterase